MARANINIVAANPTWKVSFLKTDFGHELVIHAFTLTIFGARFTAVPTFDIGNFTVIGVVIVGVAPVAFTVIDFLFSLFM
jgi:hypothetical protein